VFADEVPCKKITNQNYYMYLQEDSSEKERRKIENIQRHILNTHKRAQKAKLKLEMYLED